MALDSQATLAMIELIINNIEHIETDDPEAYRLLDSIYSDLLDLRLIMEEE